MPLVKLCMVIVRHSTIEYRIIISWHFMVQSIHINKRNVWRWIAQPVVNDDTLFYFTNIALLTLEADLIWLSKADVLKLISKTFLLSSVCQQTTTTIMVWSQRNGQYTMPELNDANKINRVGYRYRINLKYSHYFVYWVYLQHVCPATLTIRFTHNWKSIQWEVRN